MYSQRNKIFKLYIFIPIRLDMVTRYFSLDPRSLREYHLPAHRILIKSPLSGSALFNISRICCLISYYLNYHYDTVVISRESRLICTLQWIL